MGNSSGYGVWNGEQWWIWGLRWGGGVDMGSGMGWEQSALSWPCTHTAARPQTYIGEVVISVNPYKPLPIYTPEKVEEYHNCNFFAVKPHM